MTLKQVEPKKIVYTWGVESDMQWPCPSGFHVPTMTEWQSVYNIWRALGGATSGTGWTNFGVALKLPFAWRRLANNSNVNAQGAWWHYVSSVLNGEKPYYLFFESSSINSPQSESATAALGYSIRAFKNTPVVPTSSWTKMYWTSIESWWIFWDSTEGLISLSSNWSSWVTMQDKNLWATTVWNSWDTLSEANCGWYFQRWNNYMFPWTWSVTTFGTRPTISGYWPWNYYSSSTFIITSEGEPWWYNSSTSNLWWWVSQWTYTLQKDVKRVMLGSTQVRPKGWQPWANTIAYYPLTSDFNDQSWNGYNLINNGGVISNVWWIDCGYYNGSSYSLITSWPSLSNTRTISCWRRPASTSNVMWIVVTWDRDNAPNIWGLQQSSWEIRWSERYTLNQSVNSWVTVTVNNWYYLVTTINNGTTAKIYVNWNLKNTITRSTPIIAWTNIGIWIKSGPNYSEKAIGYVSNAIIESVAWTDQEISDYYNQTKANYWIS